jgi:hypothetical protein
MKYSTRAHPRSFLGVHKILGKSFFWNLEKDSSTLGGERGGCVFSKLVTTMIHISLSDSRNFGIGFEYRGKTISNYSIKKLDVHLLLFTISFVYTRFNT